MNKILILILTIIILFYFLNTNLKKKEQYLNYFIPFYNKTIVDIDIDIDNNNHTLHFGVRKEDIFFIKIFVNDYLSKSNLINATIILYNNKMQGLDDLINNKIQFLLYEYSNINYYTNVLKKNIDNIKLLTTLYKEYIYIITKKKYNVSTINEIPSSFTIGVIYNDTMYFYYKTFLEAMNIYNYKIKHYNDIEELFENFYKDNCNIILFCKVFPNKIISNLMDKYLDNEMILLPFDIPNINIFLQKQPFVHLDYIDLNLFNPSYLPTTFGKYSYTKIKPLTGFPLAGKFRKENLGFLFSYKKYKPTIPILSMEKILLTNTMTDTNSIYNFIKFYYENNKSLNLQLKNSYKINTNLKEIYSIDYHQTVLQFYKEKKMISYSNNEF
jgi:hypothetical protein